MSASVPQCSSSLSALPAGESARIQSLHVDHTLRRRLQELGLIPGTRIKCLFYSCSGDPRAFLVRGTVLALRRQDSDCIRIQ